MSSDLELGPWIAELTDADLPPQLRELASVVGVEAAVKVAGHFGGCQFYVAKIDAILRQKRDQLVRRDKPLLGYKGCAQKYNLSEVWVRQICDHQDGDDHKQANLFDDCQVSKGGLTPIGEQLFDNDYKPSELPITPTWKPNP